MKSGVLRNKEGSEKYYIIMSLILGILILTISLYFIFKEFFDQDDIDWEVCRESVLLRTAKIEENGGFGKIFNKGMDSFPFKCKTEVLEIDYKNNERALEEISNKIASCFYLYGEEKKPLYATNWITPSSKHCFICNRVHFSEEVKDYYKNLNIGEYLTKKRMKGDQTYFDYVYLSVAKELISEPKEFSEYEDGIKKNILQASTFDSSNGDILIMNMFRTSASTNVPIISWFLKMLGARGWSSGILFFQPEIKPEYLSECDIIETIPA